VFAWIVALALEPSAPPEEYDIDEVEASSVEPFERGADPTGSELGLPDSGTRPLERAAPHRPSPVPIEGNDPLERASPESIDGVPRRGWDPLESAAPDSPHRDGLPPAQGETPLGAAPHAAPKKPLDKKLLRLARVGLVAGPVWRSRQVDTILSTNAEFGRMHGVSASFHTSMIVSTVPGTFFTEPVVSRNFDFPIGFGAVLRGRLGERPLYGSVGLSAGILVHRANTETGVVHRVDPDVRLPIRLAWTIAGAGVSLAIVPGYSFRDRFYERRGQRVWERYAIRIGLALGLHWDIPAGRKGEPLPQPRRRDKKL